MEPGRLPSEQVALGFRQVCSRGEFATEGQGQRQWASKGVGSQRYRRGIPLKVRKNTQTPESRPIGRDPEVKALLPLGRMEPSLAEAQTDRPLTHQAPPCLSWGGPDSLQAIPSSTSLKQPNSAGCWGAAGVTLMTQACPGSTLRPVDCPTWAPVVCWKAPSGDLHAPPTLRGCPLPIQGWAGGQLVPRAGASFLPWILGCDVPKCHLYGWVPRRSSKHIRTDQSFEGAWALL